MLDYSEILQVFGEVMLGMDSVELAMLLKQKDFRKLSERERQAYSKIKDWLDETEDAKDSQAEAKSIVVNASLLRLVPNPVEPSSSSASSKRKPVTSSSSSVDTPEPPRKSQVIDFM